MPCSLSVANGCLCSRVVCRVVSTRRVSCRFVVCRVVSLCVVLSPLVSSPLLTTLSFAHSFTHALMAGAKFLTPPLSQVATRMRGRRAAVSWVGALRAGEPCCVVLLISVWCLQMWHSEMPCSLSVAHGCLCSRVVCRVVSPRRVSCRLVVCRVVSLCVVLSPLVSSPLLTTLSFAHSFTHALMAGAKEPSLPLSSLPCG